MTELDDQLIQTFFSQHPSAPLADDGFSARVMEQISSRDDVRTAARVRRWIALCVGVALAVFFIFDGTHVLASELTRLAGNLWGALVTQMVTPQALLNTLLGVFGLCLLACLLVIESEQRTERGYGVS